MTQKPSASTAPHLSATPSRGLRRGRKSAAPAGSFAMARRAQAQRDRDDRFGGRAGRDAWRRRRRSSPPSTASATVMPIPARLRAARSGLQASLYPLRRPNIPLLVHRWHHLRPGAGDALWPAEDDQLRDRRRAHRQHQHAQRSMVALNDPGHSRVRLRSELARRPACTTPAAT